MGDKVEQQITESKKRSMDQVLASELSWKLKSKQDFYVYLDKQYVPLPFISPTLFAASSTTCRRKGK